MKTNKNQKTFDKRNFYNSKDSGLVFILALLVPFVVALVMMFLGTYIGKVAGIKFEEGTGSYTSNLYNTRYWFTIPYILSTQLSFILIYFIYHKRKKISYSATKLNFKVGYKNYILSVVIGILCFSGLILLISCFDRLWDVIGFNVSENPLPLDTFGWFVVNLIVLGLIPAICEELIFRGIIFHGLRKNYSFIFSALFSALFFALVHGSIQQLVYPFILGVILATVASRTGSIIPCMVIHFTNNFITILLTYLSNATSLDLSVSMKWWVIISAIILAFLTLLVLFVLDKFVYEHKEKDEVETEKLDYLPTIFVVGIVVGVLLVILSCFM